MSLLTILPLALAITAGTMVAYWGTGLLERAASPSGQARTADAGASFRLGLLMFLVMPTDIITMFTVGASLTRHGQPWWHSLPSVLVTLVLVGLPLIDLLLLGRRAEKLLPRVRDWMTDNSWVGSPLAKTVPPGVPAGAGAA